MFSYVINQFNTDDGTVLRQVVYSDFLYDTERFENLVKEAYESLQKKGVELKSNSHKTLNLLCEELERRYRFRSSKETFVTCNLYGLCYD